MIRNSGRVFKFKLHSFLSPAIISSGLRASISPALLFSSSSNTSRLHYTIIRVHVRWYDLNQACQAAYRKQTSRAWMHTSNRSYAGLRRSCIYTRRLTILSPPLIRFPISNIRVVHAPACIKPMKITKYMP
ncbi:hypothetical protein BDN70DRAFT_491427 [Pholiota conissans]|uniref:Uncharacterized protein n=1 Tax=Pholiota conissans TaxID=109636 RepID=A0A9P6CWI4_9AGAR|nr:hypothetical protein BDN70DRAFT_491427 [Pholiota conissans]